MSDNSGGETAQNAELVLRALAARVKLPESAAEDELEMLEQEVERQVLEQLCCEPLQNRKDLAHASVWRTTST